MIALLVTLEIFTIFVQKMVCNQFFEKKYKSVVREAAVWASFFVLFNVLTYKSFISVFMNACIFVTLFLLLLELLYRGSFKKKLLITLFMYLWGMCSEFLVYQGRNIIGIPENLTMAAAEQQLLCTIISKLIWFTAIRVMLLLWKGYKEDVKIMTVDWVTALFVPVSSIFIAATIIELNAEQKNWMNFFDACWILILNLVTFYLFDRVQANAIAEAEKEYVRKQSKRYAGLNDEIGQYWFELQSFKHDLKQRYILEQSYLQQENYEKLAECYKENIAFLKTGKALVNTGNVCIDNIINCKSLLAEKKGIQICTDLIVAYDVVFDEGDICSLIGNLLDNAVEAVENVGESDRKVKIKIKMSGENMLIATENPYVGQRRKQGEKYITTKEESNGHGIGLKIVEEVAKKYQGDVVVEDTGQIFSIKVLLYHIS